MKPSPGISIIIPTYNEAGTIKVLIEQIISLQDDKNIQVIVVDAKDSNDNISSIISSYPIDFISSTSTSRAKQMNEGAKYAIYDTLYFVHADAIPPIDFYHKIIHSLNIGNDFGYFSYKFKSNNFFLRINSYFSKFKGFYTGGGDQTFFIGKSLFHSLNGFDPKLQLCEDFNLFHRLQKENKSFEIINSPVIISDRKYQKSNYFWINLVNFYILLRFKLGHNPDNLKRQYAKLLS